MIRLLLFLLRLLGPRWGIDSDIVDYLEASQHLGRDSRIPTQLIPIGLRLWARGWLNHQFFDNYTDWVLPYWLVHQLDPADPGFSTHGLQPVLLNNSYRDWTAVGNPGSRPEAIVDPRGLVTPQFDGWSLDTWLRVGDRTFYPSRLDKPYLEQRLDESLPVVQTRYEANGLRMLQEVFAAKDAEGQDWVIAGATVENPRGEGRHATLYTSVRPFNPEGVSPIRRLEFRPAESSIPASFLVNDQLGVFVSPPAAVAAANEQQGDVAFQIPQLDGSQSASSQAGAATGLAAYELDLAPHSRQTVAAVMPMTLKQRVTEEQASWLTPEGYGGLKRATTQAWRKRLGEGMQIRLPDERLQSAFEANRAYLLLLHDGDSITPGPFTYHHFWFRDAAFMLNALSQLGYHDEVASVLRSYPSRQLKDGYYESQEGEWDSNGQALWALLQHTRLSGDLQVLADEYWSMLNGAHWIDYARQGTKSKNHPPEHGLLPSGMSAEHFGLNDFFYWDDFWGLAGLRAAADAAALFAKTDDEKKLRAAFDAFCADILASLGQASRRTGALWMPASPFRNADSAMVGNLVALYPLQLFPAGDPHINATLDELKRIAWLEDTFFHKVGHAGFGTYLALHVAGCYLYERRSEAWPIMFWMLANASPTFTWAEALSPLTHHGGMGDGHHGWAAADWVSIVRNALLFEEDRHLVLTPALPREWTYPTLSLSVEKAATYFGNVGYTIAFSDNAATLVLKGDWREPPEYIEWNLPFALKNAGGGGPGVELVENRVRIPPGVRKVVATW